MSTRLHIGNLSFDTSSDALRASLEADGRQVTDLHRPTDRETGRMRGFAFAEIGSETDAQRAIGALQRRALDGRTLSVNEAREREPRSGGGGGGGGSRGRGGNRW